MLRGGSREVTETPTAEPRATPHEPAVGSVERRMPLMHLQLAETGARHPDRRGAARAIQADWFALGGILVNAEDEASVKASHLAFRNTWSQIRSPLHLTDMRAEKKAFAWLGRLTEDERVRFWTEYGQLLTSLPVIGSACVIDRPGYRARGYGGREGDKKWFLCRSAFDIVVERAAKFAAMKGRRLRVFYEKADPVTDTRVEEYFRNLREAGLGFDAGRSAKYNPLSQTDLSLTLLSVEGKPKSSILMQIADSYVYALARGGYERKFALYRRLLEGRKIVTSHVPAADAPVMGVKYYCFDHKAQTTKAGGSPGL